MGEESRLDQFLKTLADDNPSLRDQLSNPVMTEKDLADIIDAELLKAENEMDIELIDLCVEALLVAKKGLDAFKHEQLATGPMPDDVKEYLLNQKRLAEIEQKEVAEPETKAEETASPELTPISGAKPKPEDDPKKKKRRRYRYITLVAAVVTLLCGLAVVSSAGLTPFRINEDLVSFVDEYLKIDFGKAKTNAEDYTKVDNDLTKELSEHGFDSLILPKDLLDNWKENGIRYNNSNTNDYVEVNFENNKEKASIAISRFKNEADFQIFAERTYVDANHGTQKSYNDIDVLILQVDKYSLITYFDKNTLSCYTITVPGGQDKAMKIAESIQ